MIPITESLINMLAPNGNAVANGRRISQKGGFSKLQKSGDDTYICGECEGSGKTPYITSADFFHPENPVFRCTCPSRQFPCKHAVGLMFEYISDKNFEICVIPENIVNRRTKNEQNSVESEEKNTRKKNAASAASKKIKKQLEGLDLAERFIDDILCSGISSLAGNSLKSYRDLAKQMGDYYLPGIQAMINKILAGIEKNAENTQTEEDAYRVVTGAAVELYSTVKKAGALLSEKMNSEDADASAENSALYDKLGYVRQLSQLDRLGLYTDNCEIVQLSFYVGFDEAKDEYADTGYWINLSDGIISKKENLRPSKAVKYIKQDDTVFDVLVIPRMYFYPGEINKRVRWDNFTSRSITAKDTEKIKSLARTDIDTVIREVKNQIKNPLSEKTAVYLIAFEKIGRIGEKYVMETQNGVTLELSGDTADSLCYVPSASMLENQALTSEFVYDPKSRTISAVPHSIVTDSEIIRLMY